jgi:hypothetical protein
MSKKRKFTTVEASTRLLASMEVAINNMIDEVRKPVDGELSGSQRKAELQSIKQTATDAKELLIEYQRLEQMVRELKETGGIGARLLRRIRRKVLQVIRYSVTGTIN